MSFNLSNVEHTDQYVMFNTYNLLYYVFYLMSMLQPSKVNYQHQTCVNYYKTFISEIVDCQEHGHGMVAIEPIYKGDFLGLSNDIATKINDLNWKFNIPEDPKEFVQLMNNQTEINTIISTYNNISHIEQNINVRQVNIFPATWIVQAIQDIPVGQQLSKLYSIDYWLGHLFWKLVDIYESDDNIARQDKAIHLDHFTGRLFNMSVIPRIEHPLVITILQQEHASSKSYFQFNRNLYKFIQFGL